MSKNSTIATEVRGARVHNLKNIDVDVPLDQFVAISGVSGSGKSSLAMGVLYAEGSSRYLEMLSAYTRRRLSQEVRSDVDSVRHIPSAVALRQRPAKPGIRSTVGTMSEVFNHLRLMMSRLGRHVCPNGHLTGPSIEVAATGHETCEVCGVNFAVPDAESFSFNGAGACPTCDGTGIMRTIDYSSLIDDNLTIAQGAVRSWTMFGKQFLPQVAEQLGVRPDVPFRELNDKEKAIIMNGAPTKHKIFATSQKGRGFEMNVTYENAVASVENALKSAKTENGAARMNKFLRLSPCTTCGGSRLNKKALSSQLVGKNLAGIDDMTLDDLTQFAGTIVENMPKEMKTMARRLVQELLDAIQPLIDLELGYLTSARAGQTLSTGELQRIYLARTVRGQTTGVMYVLDEPSVGLHPQNIDGLTKIIRQIVDGDNSVVMVDHDVDLLRQADHMIEIGPGAGARGGEIVAQGSIDQIISAKNSRIAPYLVGKAKVVVRDRAPLSEIFSNGEIHIEVSEYYNLHNLSVDIPVGRLTTITGVSGSGKTNLILESLVPAVQSEIAHKPLPAYVKNILAKGIKRLVLSDATPIGRNARSTVATYSSIFDDIRNLFAAQPSAKTEHFSSSYFSYNSDKGWCPTCRGLGTISLDVQFLPDVEMQCPDCEGRRYRPEILGVTYRDKSIDEVLNLTVDQAIEFFANETVISDRLSLLSEIGLGYLTLGESTPTLSGGEAERLKLMSEMKRDQSNALIVFDEPSIGLHPDDVRVLIAIFDRLLSHGATIVLIEHDLDLIANSDYVIDLGPGPGDAGGKVVAAGSPDEVANNPRSITGEYLRKHLKN